MIIGQYELLNDALRNGSFPFPWLNVVTVFWSKRSNGTRHLCGASIDGYRRYFLDTVCMRLELENDSFRLPCNDS